MGPLEGPGTSFVRSKCRTPGVEEWKGLVGSEGLRGRMCHGKDRDDTDRGSETRTLSS